MITKCNLKHVIKNLGFLQDDIKRNLYYRNFISADASLYVDFEQQCFVYPEEKGFKIEERTTCNFEQAENFVVFECVCRLFEKGYRPEHITLEKTWKLGHEQKSGRADICIQNADGKDMLAIIECKTPGAEYKKEIKNTILDGGQLFSYWQQERSTKWLVLYASDFDGKSIVYQTNSIHCVDDFNIQKLAKKDTSIQLYRNAHTVKELHEVWEETYDKAWTGDVLFAEDTQAYVIGVRAIHKKDLVDFTEDDNVVNTFEEILRHNNVSDKENAFNRLVALFICKLVDEITKDDNDEVGFQYKPGETYESLQDRLQALHKEGMDRFMKENIFYVPDDYAEKLIKQFTGQKRKNMIGELQNTLRKLKYYSNNDFAFKDVHNEELFYQNGKILVEVVQLFQKYRIIRSSNLQLLGDLFEQLLNKGFKQNEGQFFTPVPITRFIWYSLPLAQMIHKNDKIVYPKVIDYACGAGHFLTEGVDTINFTVSKITAHIGDGYEWVADKLYGIEKDYRLARVSKISLFMHGAGNGNIIFGDGLENYPEKNIMPESFDILVANPPYSVSAFKPHLKLKNNTFDTLSKISNNGSEIETLFVERIAQLLKPKGIAAVILPSSILSKENESFISARESILKNFYIRAIVQFGGKTFGATNTSTVVLFLEKFDEPPKRTEFVEDSINAIFSCEKIENFEDNQILHDYLRQIGMYPDAYEAFLKKDKPYLEWKSDSYFKMYVETFENSVEYKNKLKQKEYKKMSVAQKQDWCNKRFYDFAMKREKEKIAYFAYVYTQHTLIVVSPTGNKEQENFLGYKWSNRKGLEGIQILNAGGFLFNDNDMNDNMRIASLIRQSFIMNGRPMNINALSKYYYYLPTKDMIDFTGVDFYKVLKTAKKREKSVGKGKTLYKLSDSIFEIGIGERVLSNEIVENGKIPVYSANVYQEFGRINKSKLNDFSIPTVIWGIDGDWMVNCIPAGQAFYPTDHCGYIRVHSEKVLPEYLAVALQVEGEYEGFSRTNRASTQRIKSLQIEIPSIKIQKEAIDKLKTIKEGIKNEELTIEKLDKDIKSKFVSLLGDKLENDGVWKKILRILL